MYLIHEATVKHPDGVIDVTVVIVNTDKEGRKVPKRYTFSLKSEYAARKFHSFYRKGKLYHGKALTKLKQNQIKLEVVK